MVFCYHFPVTCILCFSLQLLFCSVIWICNLVGCFFLLIQQITLVFEHVILSFHNWLYSSSELSSDPSFCIFSPCCLRSQNSWSSLPTFNTKPSRLMSLAMRAAFLYCFWIWDLSLVIFYSGITYLQQSVCIIAWTYYATLMGSLQ